MIRISTVEARNRLSDVINRAAYGKERVVLTRREKELVVIVPLEDIRLLEALEARLDLEDARAALAEVREEGSIAWEEVKAGLKPVTVQATAPAPPCPPLASPTATDPRPRPGPTGPTSPGLPALYPHVAGNSGPGPGSHGY